MVRVLTGDGTIINSKVIHLLRCSSTPKYVDSETKKVHQVHFSSRRSMSNISAPSKIPNVACCSEPKSEVERCTKFNTRGRVSNNNEANPVTTHNRYELLQEGDGVVLRQPDSDVSYPGCDHDLENDLNIEENNVELDISDCSNASDIDAPFKTRAKAQPKVAVHKQLVNKSPLEAEVQSTSKYDLPLRFKDKKLDHTNLMASCPTLQLWDKQNAFKFGFIPMGELDVPPTSSPSNINADPLTLHTMIKDSGDHNFKKCQINVKSQLNPDVWDELLTGYWDSQLPLFVRFGFSLDFDRDSILESHQENHTSAKNYPHDVQAYLRKEIGYKAILGPFDAPPPPLWMASTSHLLWPGRNQTQPVEGSSLISASPVT